MEQRSSLYKLIEKQLGGSLAEYVAARRLTDGWRPTQSWRAIASELSARIGVEVSYESLRLWFPDADQTDANSVPPGTPPPQPPPRPPGGPGPQPSGPDRPPQRASHGVVERAEPAPDHVSRSLRDKHHTGRPAPADVRGAA